MNTLNANSKHNYFQLMSNLTFHQMFYKSQMILDDLKADICKFHEKHVVEDSVLINHINVFNFSKLVDFESRIFDANHDKETLNKIMLEMKIYFQQFTNFITAMKYYFPGISENENMKKYIEQLMNDIRMLEYELRLPPQTDKITEAYGLRWFELQFIF